MVPKCFKCARAGLHHTPPSAARVECSVVTMADLDIEAMLEAPFKAAEVCDVLVIGLFHSCVPVLCNLCMCAFVCWFAKPAGVPRLLLLQAEKEREREPQHETAPAESSASRFVSSSLKSCLI